MAVLQGGRQNLPSPYVCYPKDPMWNICRTDQIFIDINSSPMSISFKPPCHSLLSKCNVLFWVLCFLEHPVD